MQTRIRSSQAIPKRIIESVRAWDGCLRCLLILLKHVDSAKEKALEKVGALPEDEQDAIASQILASLADEDAWKKRFAGERDMIRRMAREALAEDAKGETLPLDDLLC